MELRTTRFLDHIIEYCEQQFPRSCANCGLEFGSFTDFISATSPIGEPQAYDAVGDLLHEVGHLVGTLSFVNCRCGSTLTVECGDTTSDEYVALLDALAHDVEKTGLTVNGVLEVLRQTIRSRVGKASTS